MKQFFKRLSLGVVALVPLLFAFGCGKNSASAAQTTTIKIGIMSSDERIWQPIVQKLKKQRINLKLVEFSDYNQPNKALTDHQLDLNSFQHYDFLASWNKSHDTDIVAIGETYMTRGFMYSQKIKSISQIKHGDKIAISNDPTNEGHGLNVLQQAGLIKIKANVKLPTVNDITANPKKIKIIEMEAPQTARALGNVTAALVGNDIAAYTGLTEKQVIFKEKIDARSKRSINIIAANHADKNNKVYQKVVKAYQTAATEKLIKKVYKGTAFGVWTLDHA